MNEPFALFSEWFNEAVNSGEIEPTAMTLATSLNNFPTCRIVLLKKFDHGNFRFFTNLKSRKSLQIQKNDNASLCFFWKKIKRQVRIEGKIMQISELEADAYFATRPWQSQVAALSSNQSKKMLEKQEFSKVFQQSCEKLAGQKIKRPSFWSGYDLVPQYFEFWQEKEFRTHDRVCYELKNDEWKKDYLFP